MATEYLSDREQEEALRNWWRENWRWVLSGIVAGFAALAGWNYWQKYRDQQSEVAAQTYRSLATALESNDKDKVDALSKNLDANHSESPYAAQSHLLLAQAHVNGGRFEMAATDLKTVVEKSSDPALVQIAKLRLARVHIQLGHYDDALALLDVNKAGASLALTQEIRGDALLAKGDSTGARAAYQAALTAMEAGGNRRVDGSEFVRLKLQDLDVTASPAPSKEAVSTAVPATDIKTAPENSSDK